MWRFDGLWSDRYLTLPYSWWWWGYFACFSWPGGWDLMVAALWLRWFEWVYQIWVVLDLAHTTSHVPCHGVVLKAFGELRIC